jgi:XTP/dITP diphosphohydrolase
VSNPVLVLASHNSGKVREIGTLLSPFEFAVRSAKELGLPELEETGRTFAENAAIKSEAAARKTGLFALADDSGLVVRALSGAPGVHSARWAGPERDFGQAMARVEEELKTSGAADFSAKFVCALAFTRPGKATEIFEGEVLGTLTFPPRGTNGFGYDPIFVAGGMTQTFGEIEPSRKDAISHRARAFAKLSAFLARIESAV